MTEKTKEQLMKEIFDSAKNTKIDMKTIIEMAKKHPNRPIFQGVKNPEEHQERNAALYYSMQGDYLATIEHSNKGLKINPKSSFLLYLRGRSKGDIGQFAEGINDLDEAIKIEPDYAEAFVERGYIFHKKGDLSRAKNDFERGILIDSSLQQQVNSFLNKGNPNIDMVIPSGVVFKFIVEPSLSEYHQQGVKHYIITKSGLSQYFKNIDVTFFDGCYVDREGISYTKAKLKGKQMEVKVFCPEPTLALEKSKEEYFYEQVKELYSEWIIGLIQGNTEAKYSVRLQAFYYTQRMI